MRVLMLSKACIVGIYQRKLEHIAQQGVELLVLVPPSWKDERGEQQLERAYTQGYRLQDTPITFNGNFHLHFYPHIAEYMREFEPDIVHIDEEPYNFATWHTLFHARRNGAKTLFFSWQNIHRNYPPPFSWGEKWVLGKADYALVGTDSAGSILREKGYRGSLAVIPQFGTDSELFQARETPAERPFTIGYFGRLVEEKGLRDLLAAAAELSGEWRVRLIGDGPLRVPLENYARKLGIAERVTFIGWVVSTVMPQQYAEIDVFVLPSLTRRNWKEQFGRVLVEAMACGLPVVGSDSGAIPGVIGDVGRVFPEGNVKLLSDALRELQENPALRQEMGRAGRQRVLTHFTHEQIARATVDVYREVLE